MGDELCAARRMLLSRNNAHARHMLITAGPTREPIDDVRYIANRSSGRMGLSLADAARAADWQVTLLLGPIEQECRGDYVVERFESAADLEIMLDAHFPRCDVLVMTAAVADYRPVRAAVAKLPRTGGTHVLELESTPDLVARCATMKRPDQHIVGFALEDPSVLESRAREKLQRKRLDAIVANPLETMGGETIEACIFAAETDVGCDTIQVVRFERLKKSEFASRLIDWIECRWSR